MLTLYHHPRTRSSRFIFLLEELGVPYEIHRIANIRRPDGGGGVDPENPHPHGKSPALKDGETLVFESTAIALYLTDKFTQNGLGPVVGDPLRGAYVSWLAYYAGVMEPAWMSAYMKWEIPRGTAGWVATGEVMTFVNATLEKGPYILGEKFSAVDILIATTFKMLLGTPLLAPTPLLEAYVKRVTDRPAYARAQAREVAD
jgi:glutathione S-transferase